jgi:hypothetical protein
MVSWRFTSTISLTFIVTGCANFQAVNTTAGQLVSAASSWNSVAQEFSASCVRRNQVSTATSACTFEKNATDSIEAANKILSAYFTALQQASTGSNFSVDSGISTLAASVQSFPGTNVAQTQALTGLASLLADFATKALEQRTIDQLISVGAPKAEAVIDVMTDTVAKELTSVFARETDQTLTTFSSYIQQSGSSVNLKDVKCAEGLSSKGFDTGTAYLLSQAYCARIAAILTKTSALDDYKKSLATSKAALKNLESGKGNLSAKEIAQQLISQASSLKNDIDKINMAF